jgi:uncharacterized HAD superfamily protein/hypoxanthine phosphoribosyltransferase
VNYRSVADLARCVRENLHRIPADVDLVVGVPRSGLLAANLIALGLNLKLIDLHGFLDDAPLPPANLRSIRSPALAYSSEAKHVLVVEDSILSGGTLRRIRAQVGAIAAGRRITYCAVYATAKAEQLVDVALEVVPAPRAFEWNLMHRELLQQCCVDIDGVLCLDPDEAQNDDGECYQRFLLEVPCLIHPTWPVGHLVTSRLERYRPETERWLADNDIRYQHLHMLNLPDAESRRRTNAHAPFKAAVYRSVHEAALFIESDPGQAEQIALLSGRPVLCHTTQRMVQPGMSAAYIEDKSRKIAGGLLQQIRRLFPTHGR